MVSYKQPPPRFADIPGVDSRTDWLLGPGLQDFLPDDIDPTGTQPRIPFTMRLPSDEAVDIFKRLLGSFGALVRLNTQPSKLMPSTFFTGFASKEFFDRLLNDDDFREFRDIDAKEIQLSSPLKAGDAGEKIKVGIALPEQPGPPPGTVDLSLPYGETWPADTVVVAVIDDGIGFAHERFRDRHGRTRVQCFWRQDAPYDEIASTVPFGREICKGDGSNSPGIDTLLADNSVAGSIDEDAVYRAARVVDFSLPANKPITWRIAHGTHVMDLAAGAEPGSVEANPGNRPIIAVQLPIATTQDTSGASLAAFAIEAVDYILDRVDEMSQHADCDQLPVVINFSYGLVAGPHDGTSLLERFLDEKISERNDKLRVVIPAGNSHLSRTHAEVRFESSSDQVLLDWRVQPDDRTPSFVEIWMPCRGEATGTPPPSRVRIEITAPDGATNAVLDEDEGSSPQTLTRNSQEFGRIEYHLDAESDRGMFRIYLHPTARLQPTATPNLIAPHGLWTITLKNQGLGTDESIQIWIERDDKLYGYPRNGRQSYFDEACYRRFVERPLTTEPDPITDIVDEDGHPDQPPCHVQRAGLINGIATGELIIVAGGYKRKEGDIAPYSAGGPITEKCDGLTYTAAGTAQRKPDAVLVSDDSKVHEGVLAAGTHSGSRVAINGTSIAAPQLARWIADDLASGGAGNRDAVKAIAQAQNAGEALPPNDRGGWGRMRDVSADLPIVKLDRYWG